MNGPDATPPYAGDRVYGFSIPSSNAPVYRNQAPGHMQRSWTEAMPTIGAQPVTSSQSIPSEQNTEPGWRLPSAPPSARKSTINFPEPLNLGAPSMSRRRSAPVPDYNPYAPPFSAPPLAIAQSKSHGRMGFPEPNLYPLDEESHIPHSASVLSTHFAEEPQMMTPESATSTLPPVTPGRPVQGVSLEIDPIKGDMLEAAVDDIKIVKTIFCGWYDQLYVEL